MTKTYTLVCTTCHAGWLSETPTGKCRKGHDGLLRGTYIEVKL